MAFKTQNPNIDKKAARHTQCAIRHTTPHTAAALWLLGLGLPSIPRMISGVITTAITRTKHKTPLPEGPQVVSLSHVVIT
jgi:hypothetical protein